MRRSILILLCCEERDFEAGEWISSDSHAKWRWKRRYNRQRPGDYFGKTIGQSLFRYSLNVRHRGYQYHNQMLISKTDILFKTNETSHFLRIFVFRYKAGSRDCQKCSCSFTLVDSSLTYCNFSNLLQLHFCTTYPSFRGLPRINHTGTSSS